jgi:uncharacterized protein with PIN domain
MDGRDAEMLQRIAAASERQAQASEDLLALAREERMSFEPGPAMCPHCNAISPMISEEVEESIYPMNEHVLIAHCHQCGKPFFALADGWSVYVSSDDVKLEVARRRAGNVNAG